MDDRDRLNLKKMINENNIEDQTELIRSTKQSDKIRMDVQTLLKLMHEENDLLENDPEAFNNMAIKKCDLLFNNYMDIFHKIKKKELELSIFHKFLDVLKKIEEGEVDQHEGSYEVGKYLKELYIDSALKQSENLDKKYGKENEPKKVEKERNVTWKEYKNQLFK